ncbi:T6SS immunity protein Tdi1 domain-containing protein [Cellulomonas sp.]|uniref:T6SS immunity protein Tdi1 domain-containing protein n=1 Tax=Cellulomonas sp. TaxID=40001 RepID=UPI003BAA388D
MFERFSEKFGPLAVGGNSEFWFSPPLAQVVGYTEIASISAGTPLGGGMFFLLSASQGDAAQEFISTGFPKTALRATPVARDWLGRVFAVDAERKAAGLEDQLLFLIEPGSGGVFDVDYSFKDLLDVGFVDDPDTYLARDFFEEWLSSGGVVPDANQCVGFTKPLFLGGSDSIENLDIVDLEVYWSLCAQLIEATRLLPPGTQVGGVSQA